MASHSESVAKGNCDLQAAGPTESFCPRELLNRCLGNVEFATRIIDRFLSCLPEELQALSMVQKSRDAVGMARIAHRMKGAAANVSARRLHWLIASVETNCRQQTMELMDELITAVHQEAQKLLAIVEQWRNQVGSSKWSFSAWGMSEQTAKTPLSVDRKNH